MRHMDRHTRLACLVAGGLVALPAPAQDTYTLSEEDQWVRQPAEETTAALTLLSQARQALAAGEHERAERLAGQWIERFPRHERLPEAYLLRGDALVAQQEYYEALFDYELIARSYPGSETFVTALSRELEIARLFARGTKRKLWGLRIIDAGDDAEELLIRIQERLPGSRLAEEAGLELGEYYFRRQRMELAIGMDSIFIENYPDSEHVSKVKRRLIRAHMASSKGPEFDAAGLHEARALLERLRIEEPAAAEQIGAEALLRHLDESDALKLLTTARWYIVRGDVIAAEFTLRRLIRTYPRTIAAGEALKMLPGLLARLPATVRAEAADAGVYPPSLLGVEPEAPGAARERPAGSEHDS